MTSSADRIARRYAASPHVEPMVAELARLVDAARASDDVELVYVNDNYEDFTATRHDIVQQALGGRHPRLIEPIVPPGGVDFLQKARHSAFYSTALDHLLRERGVETVVLAGQVTSSASSTPRSTRTCGTSPSGSRATPSPPSMRSSPPPRSR